MQTELLLDKYQMEIVHSKNNHILLKGDYGTGKSIICLKKLELLSKKITRQGNYLLHQLQ